MAGRHQMSITTRFAHLLERSDLATKVRYRLGTTGRRMAKGAIWTLSGSIVNRGLGLLGTILVARLLGAEQFGVAGVIQQLVSTVGGFIGLGIGGATTQFLAAALVSDRKRAGRVLGVSFGWAWGSAFVGSLGIVIFSDRITGHLIHGVASELIISLSCWLLAASLLAQSQTGALMGFEKFSSIAFGNAISGLLSIPAQYVLVRILGIPGFIAGVALGETIRWLVGSYNLRIVMRANGVHFEQGRVSEFREMLCYAIPNTFSGAMVGSATFFCSLIIGKTGAGFGDVGIYNAAQQFRMILTFVATQACASLVPIVASVAATGDQKATKEVIEKAFVGAVTPTVVGSLALSVLSPWLSMVFGESYGGRTIVVLLVIAMAPIQAANMVGISSLNALRRPLDSLSSTVLFAISMVIVTKIIPSAEGLALATALGSLLSLFMLLYKLRSIVFSKQV